MFIEDVRRHALPYGLGADDGYDVEIASASEEVGDLVRDALPIRGYRHWRLEDSLRDYMGSALWFLVQGDLFLEIEYFRKPEDAFGRPVAFRVEFLQPELVDRRFGSYRYLVPSESNETEETLWIREKLEAASLVVVSLPRRLRREVNRALRAIRAADQDLRVMTDFTTGRYGANSGFDFTSFQRESRDIVLRATAATGWSGRGLYTEGLLDPEKAWRAIQFERFVAALRDAALAGLQRAIDRAGAQVGFTAQLELARVLIAGELDGMKRDLNAGTRPMGELLNPRHNGDWSF